MFSNMLGKMGISTNDKEKMHNELVERISRMNLTDMRSYINNRIPDLPVSADGLQEVLKRLLEVDEKSQKRYIDIEDMDSKIRKGLDLILSILANKKLSIEAIEVAIELFEVSKEMIIKYDIDNKQIYYSKIRESLNKAIEDMNKKSEIQRKMSVIGS
ncbi:hypothetical protein M947_02555 [Sulfurimonas hongkongensis]|uniref:Uncharacterized protein n=1 Tax=Sulfurimonas hongkongensis TaxID=1172190 RepID=T0JGQ2_9BACT|nr:hypothetical protein [Sulfurimonas hongkongensis]EQB40235.1 hypothetical protein M947_02555 [Sulfurimonas hongkongensis]